MKQLGDEINTSILKIASQVQETESEFIFRFLSAFAHSTYQVVIEKEELFKAIQLIRMSKEYGPRRCHKLDCWREFCDFVETLPYSELITGE